MLEAKNLGCIRGDRRLFAGLNFKVPPGELVELHGPNGAGKTSLLRIMCGLAEPAEGEIRWQNKNIRALAEEYYANIVYLQSRTCGLRMRCQVILYPRKRRKKVWLKSD